jgi:aldose 1-epimerase
VGHYVLQANVGRVWEADANNLPTGRVIALPPELDFRHPRPIDATALDHVLTDVTGPPATDTGLVELAVLSHPETSERLSVHADSTWRELVLFTPAHRQAIAIEPYSCSADASNLAARGIDTGWRQIHLDEVFKSVVEYRWC